MGPPPLPCAVPRALPPAEASPAPTTAMDSAAAALPSALSYTPPPWSAPPSSTFTLEAIKDGLVVEALDVSARPYYVIGRHPSTADLVVAHPSVSRQHAVLQFRDTGEAFLFDLGSTHGTTINKQAVPARTYVAVRVGAMIRLGQSSRTLCLMGDANPAHESDTDAAAAAAAAAARTVAQEQRAEQRAARIAAQTGRSRVTESDLHAAGAGWGFDEDAVDGDAAAEADEDSLGAFSFEQLSAQAKAKGLPLTAKQERLVEQLDKRVTKMEHVKHETERIAAKEVDGLSEGQSAQIERNARALAQLSEQVESIKEQLSVTLRDQLGMRRMLDGKAAEVVAERVRGSDDEYADSDGDDDYFDRTASHRGRGTARSRQQQQPKAGPHASGRGGGEASAESEASLRAKLSATQAERVEVVLASDALSAERAALETQAAADPLEAYMLANTAEMHSRRARELSSRLEELTADEARLRKLIAFVAPALSSLPPASAAAAAHAATSLAAPPSMAASTKRPAPMPLDPVPRGLPSPAEDGSDERTSTAKRARAATEAAESAEQDSVASVAGPPKPRSASEHFRSQYAAAVSSLTTSGPISVAAIDVPADAGSSNRAGGSSKADEAQATGEARSGLGFGAARPDAARVDSARQAMLAAQAQAKRESALAPGLNLTSGQPLSAVHPPLAPPPGGPKRGPSMPPPPPAAARRAAGGANQQTGRRAHDEEALEKDAPMCTSDEFEWRPPLEQDGSGQTALNKRLGY
jgi:hypothetical protein